MSQLTHYPAGPISETLAGDVPAHRLVGFNRTLSGDSTVPIGVTNEFDYLSGDEAVLYTRGIVLISTAEAGYVGDALICAANGKVKGQTGSAYVVGYAMEDFADASLVRVKLV
ncbi:MAG: capsid cement protein [Candidatus Kapaibacterium sp.]